MYTFGIVMKNNITYFNTSPDFELASEIIERFQKQGFGLRIERGSITVFQGVEAVFMGTLKESLEWLSDIELKRGMFATKWGTTQRGLILLGVFGILCIVSSIYTGHIFPKVVLLTFGALVFLSILSCLCDFCKTKKALFL